MWKCRFRTLNLSSFWSIFIKLCMDIDIREEWFGIANGLNSFINNRVMAVDWCKNVFFLNIFRTSGWFLIKFCICIDKYKIHIVSNARYFWSIFNRVMALIDVRILFMLNILWIICGFRSNFVYALILTRYRFGWLNNIFRSFSTELWSLVDGEISFMLTILWTFWWILITFCKCIDIDKMSERTIINYFSLFFNGVMALDWCQNFVSI